MQVFLATYICVSALFTLLSSSPMFPLLLRANALIASNVSHQGLQLLWVLLAGLVLQFLATSSASCVVSLAYVVIAKYSPWWLAGFLVSLCLACSLARIHIIHWRKQCIYRRFRLPTATNSFESHALRLANVVPIFQEEHKPSRLAHDVRVLNLMARL